jgi:predicted metal-binding membrane protein
MVLVAPARRRVRVPPVAVALWLVAAVAWIGTIAWAARMGMGAMPGTLGFGIGAFVAMWTLMMAAMMLPSVWPFVAMYTRTVRDHRVLRTVALASGYLLVWAAAGVVAFGLAWTFGRFAEDDVTVAHAVAVLSFAACGVYQLTPLKYRCLSHCRTPLSHLLHYASFTGRLRDVRAGVSHGFYCLGCCWTLMVLLVAFGVMNIPAMVGLALVITVEKVWSRGEAFARVVGVGALVYAVVLVFEPGLAPGLDPDMVMRMNDMAG